MTQKQRIILDHLNGISNREIARVLHMGKDTVNKYVKKYDDKRAELLAQDPSMDQSTIIQAFVEEPRYDCRNRGPKQSTEEAMTVIEQCLKMNEIKRANGMRKQKMKKIDFHEYLIKLGFDISYSTVKRLMKKIEDRNKEAYIRQEYKQICCNVEREDIYKMNNINWGQFYGGERSLINMVVVFGRTHKFSSRRL